MGDEIGRASGEGHPPQQPTLGKVEDRHGLAGAVEHEEVLVRVRGQGAGSQRLTATRGDRDEAASGADQVRPGFREQVDAPDSGTTWPRGTLETSTPRVAPVEPAAPVEAQAAPLGALVVLGPLTLRRVGAPTRRTSPVVASTSVDSCAQRCHASGPAIGAVRRPEAGAVVRRSISTRPSGPAPGPAPRRAVV